MTNTNCLEGIQCPQCGGEDRFRISATSTFTVTDDGTEDHGDVEWDDDNYAECTGCHHRGTLKDFRPVAGLEAAVSIHLYHITAWCDRTFTTVFDVEAESPEQALAIAKERAHDEPAEECNDDYPWDTFSVANEHDVELLAWAEKEVTLRKAAPKLLTALKDVLAAYCYWLPRYGDKEAVNSLMVKTASTAIAEAEAAGIVPAPVEIDIRALLAQRRQIAAIWSVEDVQSVAPNLTDDQCWEALQKAERQHDAGIGINWSVLIGHADEYLGEAAGTGAAEEA
jgi:hypothetical protein